ncbi:MAG: HD domain-containing protein, partial [Bacteroidota bacterium]
MNHNNDILNQAQAYVSSLLNGKLPGWAVYHNLRHTEEIVEAVQEIGEGSRLNKSEMEIVLLAAWFHDVGYTEVADGHEEKGVEIATRFLQAKGYPQNKIEQVGGCIRATKVPQSPKTFFEEIVCDADVIHLGKKRF